MLPDYAGNGVANLMVSMINALKGDAPQLPEAGLLTADRLRDRRHLVFVVIDGLGDNTLRGQPGASCLNEHRIGRLTSVFPSTTASGITTYLTGVPPSQHGLTGWHMFFRELAAQVTVLPGHLRCGGHRMPLDATGIDLATLLDHKPVSERLPVECHSVSPHRIADSSFNLSHLGRSQLHPYGNLAEMFDRIASILANSSKRNFVYAYWPDLDEIGHHAGMGSREAAKHLLTLDGVFEGFLERLKGLGAAVILCADHGQVDVSDGGWIHLNDHPELRATLRMPLCGEPRVAYAHVRDGAGEDLLDYCRSVIGDQVDVRHADDVLSQGWYGPGPLHPELRYRIGDYLLLPKGKCAIRDPFLFERPAHPVGVHGGLSEDELLVPLVLAEP